MHITKLGHCFLVLEENGMKISEASDFAKLVKSRVAFGVHDGTIVPGFGGFAAKMLQNFLKPDGIEYVVLGAGESKEF
jgi:hypothetical protein